MQVHIDTAIRRRAIIAVCGLSALAAIWALRAPLLKLCALLLTAALLCLAAAPLACAYERKLSRPLAALASLLTLGIVLSLLGALLFPRIVSEMIELSRVLPQSMKLVAVWLEQARGWAEARLPGITLQGVNADAMNTAVQGLANGTISLAGSLADATGRFSMAVVLAYFFLRDRDRLLLRLELLLPQKARQTAVRMAAAVCRELRLYLRGQLMVAAAVGLLAAAALAVVGVRSALALGLIIGLFNMIPYFGPFIGGIPAVLIALGDGWQRAAVTVLALALVQQLDGAWISPRIMGSLSGFSPALVLVGLYAGSQLAGIPGMLFALPLMMAIRTLFRVFVQKCENI